MSYRMKPLLSLAVVMSLLPVFALRAQQAAPAGSADPKAAAPKEAGDPIPRIKEEGLNHSQVMQTLSYMTDVIGPRLTGSPNLKRANEWTRDKLGEWGLKNAHLEAWGPFGRGWTLKRFSAQVVEPQCIPLIAYPKAWSPGTDGPVTADVVHFKVKAEADFAKYKGKLKGAIVLMAAAAPVSARFEPMATRFTDTELLSMANADTPAPRAPRQRPAPAAAPNVASTNGSSTGSNGSAGGSGSSGPGSNGSESASAPASGSSSSGSGEAQPGNRRRNPRNAAQEFRRKMLTFLMEEGAAVAADTSLTGDGGTLFVDQADVSLPAPSASNEPPRRISAWDKDAPRMLPQITVSKEHYNRMIRMIEQGEKLRVSVDLAVAFHDDDPMSYNTVAEIPGSDLKDELVMLGGHLDSWHSGTGATDNAAGCAVAMEAMRILQALDLKPRRTVRIALWTGEEQGLNGSRAYVADHFGKVGDGSMAAQFAAIRGDTSPKITLQPEHEKLSGYFNLDNGTGKVRGIYLQGNDAVRPIFRKWLAPFRDMGAATITASNTGGTDHESFDAVGLPGFQFIQDGIDYNTRTHHSNQDVYDRIQADDMKQASVIMAAFVYNTAMRDEKLPRKPTPGKE
ncbi:MAG TPA: M20/M25/M40 family metallo-hydrolase [Isosphaeraceae bacterium]|jgi:hypothetical protein|nr:M20/M25/M40 family metallo-hydrolase [Isosphaeraceae bacterium]